MPLLPYNLAPSHSGRVYLQPEGCTYAITCDFWENADISPLVCETYAGLDRVFNDMKSSFVSQRGAIRRWIIYPDGSTMDLLTWAEAFPPAKLVPKSLDWAPSAPLTSPTLSAIMVENENPSGLVQANREMVRR